VHGPYTTGIQEMLGDIKLKALIIAYHAVPKTKYSSSELEQRWGLSVVSTSLERFFQGGVESVSGHQGYHRSLFQLSWQR
jgi:hypothetical protein